MCSFYSRIVETMWNKCGHLFTNLIKITITTWLYFVECPQYNIRLEALGYVCDCLSGRGLTTSSGHAHLDRQRYVACRQPASDVAENLGVGFLYGVYRPGEMTLNWLQR